MRKHIPNIITSCNLLSGSIAVYFATEQQYIYALLFILLGAFFDFFDGLSARWLKVSSPIGKELDSLADDITFGLAPTMALFCYLKVYIGWWALLVLVMAAFSALRLAKFNLDERQATDFIGLATPANALFWASVVAAADGLLTESSNTLSIWLPIVLLLLCFLSCYLLVSEIPMFSLKFHDLSWDNNKVRFIFLAGVAVIIVFFIVWAFMLIRWQWLLLTGAAIIVWYVLMSLIALLPYKR